jgi:uncharacterized protein
MMIMSKNNRSSRLRFNFGFLLEADLGTSRKVELDYPAIRVADEVSLSYLNGSFVATRTSEGVYLSGRLESAIEVECVRCLGPMMLPIALQIDELFYYPVSAAPEGESLVFEGESGYIDLEPIVRELSLLEVPIQPICKADCKGLCVECGQDLNVAQCGCEVDEVDPRLAGLRALLD